MNMVPVIGMVPDALPLDEMKPWNAARQMLVCTAVHDEAPDVKTFTFAAEGGGWFRYQPGQFVTLELRTRDGDLHRTYTISSTPSRPYAISVTVKAQPGSIGTRWMFDHLRPGSRVRAYGPNGHFTLNQRPGRKFLFVSAGSGITPTMSMLRFLSDCAPATDVVFINSARRPEDIIFREELALLAARMPNLSLGFLPESRSAGLVWAGLTGRIDRHKMALLAPDFIRREVYCCGPEPFMKAVSGMLRAEGFDMGHYHQESFGAASIAQNVRQQAEERAAGDGIEGVAVDFLGSGRKAPCEPGQTVLQAARAAGVRIPAACESGICGTCKVLKRDGEVDMRHNGGISNEDIAAGFILACCSRPLRDVAVEA